MAKCSVSERFACRVLGQHRSTKRKKPSGRADEAALTADIIRLATGMAATAIAASQRAEIGGLVGERQARRTDLATEGAESAIETTKERAALAE